MITSFRRGYRIFSMGFLLLVYLSLISFDIQQLLVSPGFNPWRYMSLLTISYVLLFSFPLPNIGFSSLVRYFSIVVLILTGSLQFALLLLLSQILAYINAFLVFRLNRKMASQMLLELRSLSVGIIIYLSICFLSGGSFGDLLLVTMEESQFSFPLYVRLAILPLIMSITYYELSFNRNT